MSYHKPILAVISVLAFSSYAYCQEKPAQMDSTEKWEKVDVMPEFPGGMGALMNFITKNTIYPKEAKKIQGTVLVEFIIDSTGVVLPETVNVVTSVHPLLDEEAKRIIKLSPAWTPGKVSNLNKAVQVRYRLPVRFKK